MKNTLFRRISKIVSANVNSILDTIENTNPEAVMKQAIQEVEDVIEDVRVELREAVASKYLANKQLLQKNNSLEELAGQIEIALKEDREDLAEAAISKQLDIEDQLPILEKTLHDCQEEEKELEGYLNALKSKVKEMNHDLNMLNAVNDEVESSSSKNSDVEMRVVRAESSFDQVFQTASELKGVNGRTGIKQEGQLQELEALERQNRIKERMQRYKG
jgi:phage shock protein A